jgi:excisionase family DNA binding protein
MRIQSDIILERRALRPKEAAQAYGISRTSIYELLKSGRLRSTRLGGARLIPVDALEALVDPSHTRQNRDAADLRPSPDH